MAFAAPIAPSGQLIEQLSGLARQEGLSTLASRLTSLHQWIKSDLADFESELDVLPRGERAVQQCAHHLLDLGGKHLRPMCVLLANKVGRDCDEKTRALAAAVEWIHAATLLHDDVVDVGDTRRGAKAARLVYGNAASIFAGDWLLVKALKRIREAGIPGLLEKMLDIIDEMIIAESVQLENRGKINASIDDYFHVVEGKTAALFRWAMYAGARAGNLSEERALSLEQYGLHLGIAFQLVDDLLDINGDAQLTGKALFADLREGKMTYPIIMAIQADSTLTPKVKACAQIGADQALPLDLCAEVILALGSTGALDSCRQLAEKHVERAIAQLDKFPDGPAKESLITVAKASIRRTL